MKIDRYSINLIWSEEDQSCLAQIPELPGCAADGATVEEAIANLDVVAQEWIETAEELGREIPKPVDLTRYLRQQKDTLQQQADVTRAVKILTKSTKSRIQTATLFGPSLHQTEQK